MARSRDRHASIPSAVANVSAVTPTPDGFSGVSVMNRSRKNATSARLGSTLNLAGGYYWIGGVVQGTPATQPTVRAISGNTVPAGFILSATTATPTAGQVMFGVGQGSTSGALPATLPSPGGSAAAPIRVFMKCA